MVSCTIWNHFVSTLLPELAHPAEVLRVLGGEHTALQHGTLLKRRHMQLVPSLPSGATVARASAPYGVQLVAVSGLQTSDTPCHIPPNITAAYLHAGSSTSCTVCCLDQHVQLAKLPGY